MKDISLDVRAVDECGGFGVHVSICGPPLQISSSEGCALGWPRIEQIMSQTCSALIGHHPLVLLGFLLGKFHVASC
jgi:hypothetical protein